jgi:hypothetical protein
MNMVTRKPRFGRRDGERGQMVPLAAIFALLLLAAVALATDLSVSTHYKRSLQNATDAASLAGAKLLPPTVTGNDQQKATAAALQVLHNSYPFSTPGSGWAANWASLSQVCNGSGCSITVCAGKTPPGGSCTENESQGSATPSWFVVNTPPKTAKVAQYNGDVHRVEVYGSQIAGAFFAGLLGYSANSDAAESVAWHFASGQPFGFALWAKTVVLAGNHSEEIRGNIYADRFLDTASSSTHEGICAEDDPAGNPGYIVLGSPQYGDSGYQNDGQSSTGLTIIGPDNNCPESGGNIGMTGTPSANKCASTFGNTASSIGYDSHDNACEATPSITPPPVAALPNLPTYPPAQKYGCGGGLLGGLYQAGEYGVGCTANNAVALTVDHAFVSGGGIYEIDHNPNSSCDVSISDPTIPLNGITWYLKNGAIICVGVPGGQTVSQTPYNAGTGDAGDGRYDILSDNVGNPSINFSTSGSGSQTGIYSLSGVIWLPTGSVNAVDKEAIVVSGQVIVGTWNDKSGNHTLPSVTYNPNFAPSQNELLELTE